MLGSIQCLMALIVHDEFKGSAIATNFHLDLHMHKTGTALLTVPNATGGITTV
jgi:hypothetical protein